MGRLENIQRFSGIIRYLVIAATTVITTAVLFAALTPGQDWVSIADGSLSALWATEEAPGRLTLFTVIAPVLISIALAAYWLQRLFGEYQAGRFFTDGSMRCYIWLVWLKAFYFVYSAIYPLILAKMDPSRAHSELSLTLDAGTLVELVVLIVVVHVLKAAQQINDENQAFV